MGKGKVRVSFIIVNYNAGEHLTRAVESVIKEEGVEIIVVDNASTDNSLALLRHQYHTSNLIIKSSPTNLGFGRAVALATKHARGEYLFLLNPDGALMEGALSALLACSREHGDQAIIAPRLVDSSGKPQASCYRKQSLGNAVREFWLGEKGAYSKYLPSGQGITRVHTAVAAAWLIPRPVWDQLGGFSPALFLYFEDLELCDRAARLKIPVLYLPTAVVSHAHGISSATNPRTEELFLTSAHTYHGTTKKFILDLIIRTGGFFYRLTPALQALVLILVAGSFVTAVASLGYLLLPSRFSPSPYVPTPYHHNFLLWSAANFDGEHYLRIARDGYQTVLGQSEYAFFPLLPLLLNLLSRTGLDLYLAARLVTLASLWGFVTLVLIWAKRYLARPQGLAALILLSPGAIFLFSIYTEPLFLLLTVLTFYFAQRKEWGKSLLATALATATRVNGIFLVVYLFCQLPKGKPRALLGMSGLVAYMTYLYLQTGNPLAWYSAQAGWGKATATYPWTTLISYLQALTVNFVPDLTHLVVGFEVAVTVILIYLLLRAWRDSRFDLALKLYLAGNLALPLATGSLGSMPRFALTLFPLFLVIPRLSLVSRRTIYTLFLFGCMLGIILFTRGYWYA